MSDLLFWIKKQEKPLFFSGKTPGLICGIVRRFGKARTTSKDLAY